MVVKAIMFDMSYTGTATHHRKVWSSCLSYFKKIKALATGDEGRRTTQFGNSVDNHTSTEEQRYERSR